jgi:hypothetical protein
VSLDWSWLANISIAGLMLILGFLLARQAIPILDRLATASAEHLNGIEHEVHLLKSAVERIEQLYEDDLQLRSKGELRLRRRRDTSDLDDA